jgi:hypothetical protein
MQRMSVSESLDYLAVVNFAGDWVVYEIPALPLVRNPLGLDNRVDLLLQAGGPGGEYDKGELQKLPPFNEFLRKRSVESMEEVKAVGFTEGVLEGKCRRRVREKDVGDLRKEVKEVVLKRKKDPALGAVETAKDPKKGGAVPPPAVPAKKTQKEIEEEAAQLAMQTKSAFFDNTRIELKADMKTVEQEPAFGATIYFLTAEELIEHDEYYDIERQELHKIMQDDVLAANQTKPEVKEKMLREPKRSTYTSGMVIVWRGNDSFEEVVFPVVRNRLPRVKYTKEFLHFQKRIGEYALLTPNKSPLKPARTAKIELTGYVRVSAVSAGEKYLAVGFDDGGSKVWDLQLRQFGPSFDQHSKAVTALGFYKDWILVSGSKDGTVQMYDLSLEGAGDGSTFMAQKNYFTIVQKEKWIEEQNEVASLTVSSCGLVFVVDKFKNARAYSVFHGQKMFKAMPSLHFSLETLSGSKPVKYDFQVAPHPLVSTNEGRER